MPAPRTENLIKFILERNKHQSAEFCAPGSQLARRLYRAQHPSEIIALKCMDGRLNLSLMTQTPPGILKPFRNIGGKFDLGWPFFGRLMLDNIEYGVAKGRPTIVLCTYHFSKGSKQRGCAGYNYDTNAARKGAERLRRQFEHAFGSEHVAIFALVVGIETDEGGLVLHGSNGATHDIAAHAHVDENEQKLRGLLHQMYPEMPTQMVKDLLSLVLGNQKYVQKLRAYPLPPLEREHREQIIAVGRGFDWLHLPNRALIIGPYDPKWEDAVAVAGDLVMGNMKGKRIPEKEGALLLVSAPFRSVGADHGVANEKAAFLARESQLVLKERVPAIMKKLKILAGTVDMNTREFHVLEKTSKV